MSKECLWHGPGLCLEIEEDKLKNYTHDAWRKQEIFHSARDKAAAASLPSRIVTFWSDVADQCQKWGESAYFKDYWKLIGVSGHLAKGRHMYSLHLSCGICGLCSDAFYPVNIDSEHGRLPEKAVDHIAAILEPFLTWPQADFERMGKPPKLEPTQEESPYKCVFHDRRLLQTHWETDEKAADAEEPPDSWGHECRQIPPVGPDQTDRAKNAFSTYSPLPPEFRGDQLAHSGLYFCGFIGLLIH